MEAYEAQKDEMMAVLHAAPGMIHITLDAWTSPNNIPFLGVIGHFISDDGCIDHLVLGLREIEGTHTGENLCVMLVRIVSQFNIWSKIGYFMMDNATNNDTMLSSFGAHMDTLGFPFEIETHRLRCIGHIINLAVKSFLFGNSHEAIHDEEYKDGTDEELERWRRCGPLGRAHNICIHSRGSPVRMAEFKALSGGLLIRRDNDTRWNSWYMLLESMLRPKMRAAIAQYTADHMDALAEDRLTLNDWAVLEKMSAFLKKFQLATKKTEGRRNTVGEILPVIDFLLNAFDTALKEAERQNDLAFVAMIKCGWEMLDKYFSLTDRAPVYVAAVVLHPRHKWNYFTKHWKAAWIPGARAKVIRMWTEEYKSDDNLENPIPDHDDDEFERWLSGGGATQPPDEYEDYCTLPLEPELKDTPGAISWWSEARQRKRFPNLHRMALDILSIPAMSAEVERLFSQCKRIITDDRHSLEPDSIEALECVKSLYRRWLDHTQRGRSGP
jgi:hypothetical protein